MTVDVREETILKAVIGLLAAGIVWLISTCNANQREISRLQDANIIQSAQISKQWDKIDAYRDNYYQLQTALAQEVAIRNDRDRRTD